MSKLRLLLCLFLLCAMWPFRLDAAERFFPLNAGNFWLYETSDGQHSFRIEVAIPIQFDGKFYFSVRDYLVPGERHFLHESPGVALFSLNTSNDTTKLLTSFDASGQPNFVADDRPCGSVMGTVNQTRQVAVVPTGYWEDLLRITYQVANCGTPSIESELYAPGIGLLQRTYRVGDTTRHYNLVNARVGGVVIFAQSAGITSLSVYKPQQGDTKLRMSLRTLGEYGDSLQVSFPTTQRYDAVIRDTQGRKLWQFSDGKTFLPEPATISLPVSYEINVPLEELLQKSIAPGNYTFEAWLTPGPAHAPMGAVATVNIEDFGQPPVNASAINRTELRRRGAMPLPGRPMAY